MSGFLVYAASVLLALSCSLDTFAACFAYGSKRIRIPFLSGLVITLICTAVLALSLCGGVLARPYMPGGVLRWAAFTVLFVMGGIKLLDGAAKTAIKRSTAGRRGCLQKELRFSCFNLHFILHLYADPADADVDENQVLTPGEAAALALSLSLDGMAVGFGAAFSAVSIPAVLLVSLAANLAAVFAGAPLGAGLARRLPFHASWLGGAILIALAFSKLIPQGHL